MNSEDKGVEKPKKEEKKDEPEQMTTDRFAELKNEVKLYKKLHLDYDKRLEALEK